jgi:hypothetical protein
LNKPFTKRGWWTGPRCRALSSNPGTTKKKRKRKGRKEGRKRNGVWLELWAGGVETEEMQAVSIITL